MSTLADATCALHCAVHRGNLKLSVTWATNGQGPSFNSIDVRNLLGVGVGVAFYMSHHIFLITLLPFAGWMSFHSFFTRACILMHSVVNLLPCLLCYFFLILRIWLPSACISIIHLSTAFSFLPVVFVLYILITLGFVRFTPGVFPSHDLFNQSVLRLSHISRFLTDLTEIITLANWHSYKILISLDAIFCLCHPILLSPRCRL
jgi:hypothetical protein